MKNSRNKQSSLYVSFSNWSFIRIFARTFFLLNWAPVKSAYWFNLWWIKPRNHNADLTVMMILPHLPKSEETTLNHPRNKLVDSFVPRAEAMESDGVPVRYKHLKKGTYFMILCRPDQKFSLASINDP